MTQRDAVVIVTGGNSGIGLHLTQALLAKGHRVAVADLDGGNVAPLGTTHPSQLLFVRCDVGDESAVGGAVQEVVSSWGRIDVLVNYAVWPGSPRSTL